MPSQTSTADIYVASLYSQSDGLPLWNPSPIRTGAIGYVRDGSFFTLFNIQDGPPMELHPAADTALFGRRRSTPGNHAAPSTAIRSSSGQRTLSGSGTPTIGAERTDSVSSGGGGGGGYTTPPIAPSALQSHRASDPSESGLPSSLRRSGSLSNRKGTAATTTAAATGSAAGGPRRSSVMGTTRTPPAPPASSLSDPISPTTGGTPHSTGSRTPPFTSATTAAAFSLSGFHSPPLTGGTDSQRSPRLRERDLPPEPPLPLQVEFEDLRRFDAGPRSSSSYTCLGFSAGANVPGAPVGGMWSFRSSGGDGALLIPRDPTEREQLRHVGNLKLYVKTHLRWIAYRYSVSEDIEPDDIVLVFSQDRTSDWACAVSRNTSRGAQVEFEVFSVGKASVWGEWRTAMTASQRGPHRGGTPVFNPNFAMGAAGARMQAAAHGGSHGGGSGSNSDGQKPGISFSAGGLTASFSPSLDASVRVGLSGGDGEDGNGCGGGDDDAAAAALDLRITAGVVGAGADGSENDRGGAAASLRHQQQHQGPSTQGWPLRNPYPADQAIIIKRITMKHRLPFLPASIRASAGPRRDGSDDRRREDDEDERHRSGSRRAASDSSASSSKSDEAGRSRPEEGGRKSGAFDPLALLHEYILSRAPQARASIASDTECALLLRATLEREPGLVVAPTTTTGGDGAGAVVEALLSPHGVARLRRAFFRTVDAARGMVGGAGRTWAVLSVDESGTATLDLLGDLSASDTTTTTSTTKTPTAPALQSGLGPGGIKNKRVHGQYAHLVDSISAST
ncbi:hypothetical protein V8E36_002491 [Tilletia maclaganii]